MHALGQQVFGENTVQDAMRKVPFLPPRVEWHFIGHLQSRKAGKLPGHFQWLHSLDRLKLARRLSSAFQERLPDGELNCLVQVNLANDPAKSGISEKALMPFIEQLLSQPLPGLRWRGLMTIGVRGDREQTRRVFSRLRDLQQQCQRRFDLPAFDQLSMGMSNDYALAIEEGATLLRIGTALFGERPA